jgi:hypothetical protein
LQKCTIVLEEHAASSFSVEAVSFSKAFLDSYQTAWYNIPEGSNLQLCAGSCENTCSIVAAMLFFKNLCFYRGEENTQYSL